MSKTIEFIPVRFAVLAVSDTRQIEDDLSGALLSALIEKAGHELVERSICKDDVHDIHAIFKPWINSSAIDVIISTGGTGLTGRDVSVEAHEALYEKEITAFSTIFTMVSMQKIGTSAIQSRATAGIANGKYLFALPGSKSACQDAWKEILEPQFDYRHKPCNFVEILPRLDEHLRRK